MPQACTLLALLPNTTADALICSFRPLAASIAFLEAMPSAPSAAVAGMKALRAAAPTRLEAVPTWAAAALSSVVLATYSTTICGLRATAYFFRAARFWVRICRLA